MLCYFTLCLTGLGLERRARPGSPVRAAGDARHAVLAARGHHQEALLRRVDLRRFCQRSYEQFGVSVLVLQRLPASEPPFYPQTPIKTCF